jgi:ABC-2 type transport system ATP-binding protein
VSATNTAARVAPSASVPVTAGEHVIRARGIAKSFRGKVALHPIDVELGPGGIAGLLGPNGSGKSTLLRILTGLVRPDSGGANVAGVELEGDGTAIRKRCAYAPGEIALYGEMRAREHLHWLLRGRERASITRATALAGELGLPLEKRVRAYSHGMKRQLLLAAALAPDVPVRILDEATEGLDPSKRSAVLELLIADARRGTTILLSSHHLGEVDRVCDRLVFLNEGRKIADERAAEFRARAQAILRIAFDEGADSAAIQAALAEIDGASVRVEGSRASVRIRGEDPRAFLAAACARRDLPRPRAIEYGSMSLAEIYRELYGVEGC